MSFVGRVYLPWWVATGVTDHGLERAQANREVTEKSHTQCWGRWEIFCEVSVAPLALCGMTRFIPHLRKTSSKEVFRGDVFFLFPYQNPAEHGQPPRAADTPGCWSELKAVMLDSRCCWQQFHPLEKILYCVFFIKWNSVLPPYSLSP